MSSTLLQINPAVQLPKLEPTEQHIVLCKVCKHYADLYNLFRLFLIMNFLVRFLC